MTAASKEESSQFAQIAKDLKKRLAKYNSLGFSLTVPIMGSCSEKVVITKPGASEPQNLKKGKPYDSDLRLSFEDVIIFDTPKERSAAVYLGKGVDPASGSSEHWFFSQSASGGLGAIFFGGLQSKSQLATPQYKIRKAQL